MHSDGPYFLIIFGGVSRKFFSIAKIVFAYNMLKSKVITGMDCNVPTPWQSLVNRLEFDKALHIVSNLELNCNTLRFSSTARPIWKNYLLSWQ